MAPALLDRPAPRRADPLAVLRGRGDKRMDGFSYKLAGAQFGLDVTFPDAPLSIDEGRMALTIPYADGNRRDGVGDLLEVGGIDTSRHRKNPIILFDHGKSVVFPIALSEDPETGAYTNFIDVAAKRAELLAFFYRGKGMAGVSKDDEHDHALFCEQLFDLAAKRYVRAGSIGYQTVKAYSLPADHERGTPPGLHLLAVLMLEGSLVVMPANADTVRKALALPRVCGKPLSPYLVKSLTPYAGPAKARLGYEGGRKGGSWRAQVPADPAAARAFLADLLKRKRAELHDLRTRGSGLGGLADLQEEIVDVEAALAQLPPAGKAFPTSAAAGQERRRVLALMRRTAEQADAMRAEVRRAFPSGASASPGYADRMRILRGLEAELEELGRRYQELGREEDDLADAGKDIKDLRRKWRAKSGSSWWRCLSCGNDQPSPVAPAHTKPGDHAEMPCPREGGKRTTHVLEFGFGKGLPGAAAKGRAEGMAWLARLLGDIPHQVEENRLGWRVYVDPDRFDEALSILQRKVPKLVGPATRPSVIELYWMDQIRTMPPGKTLPAAGKSADPREAMLAAFDKLDRGSNFLHVGELRRALPHLGRQQFDQTLQQLRRDGKLSMAAAEGRFGLSQADMAAAIPEDDQLLMWVMRRKDLARRAKSADEDYDAGYERGRQRAEEEKRRTGKVGPEPVLTTNADAYDRGFARGWSDVAAGKALTGVKAIRVRYRNKVVKGFAEVELRFDLSGLPDVDKQNAFLQEMDAAGFGVPSQGAYAATSPPRLNRPLRLATFVFDIEPGGGEDREGAVADAIREATALASRHGARFLGNVGGKALTNVKAEKRMASKTVRTKNLPDEPLPEETAPAADLEAPPEEPLPDEGKALGEDSPPEKLGAQLLRRIHEDHTTLMQDYDEALALCENESVRKLVEKVLGGVEKTLTGIEDCFGAEYPDLPGLENALGKDLDEEAPAPEEPLPEEGGPDPTDTMDDAAVPADSVGEDELPTPEEAVEGMKTKGLRGGRKGRWAPKGKKGVCPGCGKADCDCQDGKALTGDEADAIKDEIDQQAADTEAKDLPDPDPDALDDREKGWVGEAAGFLKQLAEPESAFDDEERFKSYHYHKTLDGIARLGEVTDELNAGAKDIDWARYNGALEHVSDGAHPDDVTAEERSQTAAIAASGKSADGMAGCKGRKCCAGPAQLFKELAYTKNFGDPHRARAGEAAGVLDALVNGDVGAKADEPIPEEPAPEAPEEEGADAAAFEPGERGEKEAPEDEEGGEDFAALTKELEEQDEQIKALNGRLAALAAALTKG